MRFSIKLFFWYVINFILSLLYFYILPTAVLIAFNALKSPGNDPDGALFQPVGWMLIILLPSIVFIINLYITKKLFCNKKKVFILTVYLLIIIAAIIAIFYINATYSVNYNNI